jgi:hypothetical protein
LSITNCNCTRDQELRFTVRESPDYYQLKISCFSEDKKTDLIGETWIDLKSVIIPGGGQSDLWHGLQFKGKYAGDIRVELTYYDTRPKDESVIEKRRDAEKNTADGSPSNGLSGPRQLKQVKRRPLPADPTGSSPIRPSMPEQSHSSPMPSTRSYDNLNAQHNGYSQYRPSPVSSYSNGYPPNQPVQEPSGTYDEMAGGQMEVPYLQEDQRSFHGGYAHDEDQYAQEQPFERHSYGPDHFNGQPFDHEEPPMRQDPYQTPLREERRYSAESTFPPNSATHTPAQNYESSPEYSQPRSSPASVGRTERQYQPYNRYSTSPLKTDVFRDSPLRQSISHSQEDVPRYMQPSVEDEDAPPPPPAHRNGVNQQAHDLRSSNEGQQVPMPAPLNVAPDRKSPRPFGGSDRNYNVAAQDQIMTVSPSSDYSRSSFPSHSSQSHMARGMSRDFPDSFDINEPGPIHPPNLTPGFDPTVAESESERMSHEIHQSRRHSNIPSRLPPVPQNRSDPGYGSIQQQSPYTASPSPTTERLPPQHGSAMIIKPRAVSPDPPRATPPRKSVSPRPAPTPEEPRLSAVPFSPDSYDAFNPKAGAASAVHQKPFYQTPDEAREAARLLEVEKLRAVGPIIGNDGRVIDPSDHLPTDTWAPEPERKTARKPEVVLRFKNTGTHPQPNSMPARLSPATRSTPPSTARPHSIATVPIYAHSQPATPPSFTMNHDSPFPAVSPPSQNRQGRNRLQKQNPLPQPQHPYSSPAIPTVHQTLARNPPPSEYPLRENENYNPQPQHRPISYSSSPASYRSSPYAPSTAPPIPAKIPIQAGFQNYPAYGGSNEFDALSREMSSIDIGVSGGGRPGRRMQRGGFQYREV